MNSSDIIHRFDEAKANNAIEGLVSSPQEEALFRYMIEAGLDGDARQRMINAYLAGELSFPLQAAAE